ncbi:arginine repressor [Flaviflexus salsibiostraticola]|uniref:Arginine repressor n=1 Tax=Flaviflexus salsibiostraticola TaxID=1282737 RepID=A0A3S8Z7F9_9ACTO|nr:arginine repressor [Flaviflexus salsibiostraticola]AZN29457.1 arginine repressor [Flaviflexus salsibiostraticola]
MKTTPTTRAARHAVIAEIINTSHIASQEALRVELADRGIVVTQATLSRDLDDLRATKVRFSSGRQAYVLPNPDDMPDATVAARDYLERYCRDFLLTARVAFNQVVLRTPPGAAQILASSVDRAVLEGVLGCVAGDDTVLLVTDSGDRATSLATYLLHLAEQRSPEKENNA